MNDSEGAGLLALIAATAILVMLLILGSLIQTYPEAFSGIF